MCWCYISFFYHYIIQPDLIVQFCIMLAMAQPSILLRENLLLSEIFFCFIHWFFKEKTKKCLSLSEKTPALTRLVAMERKRSVILEEMMFSCWIFGFTLLDQSIHFVPLCKYKMTVLKKICCCC